MRKFLLVVGLLWGAVNLAAQEGDASAEHGPSRIVAHRGYWQCEHSPENSLMALYKADEAGVFASEFDVILTKDSIPVVHHDDCIGELRIEEARFDQVRGKILSNGEALPTLEQYLMAAKQCKDLRLVLEIKPHLTQTTEELAAMRTVELVRKYDLQERVEYISFSLYLCETLHRLSPSSQVAYLRGDLTPQLIAEKGLTGIDYHYSAVLEHPEWIEEAHGLKLTVNVWTVNEPELIERLNEMGVDYITTNIPAEALRLVH